MWTGPKAIQVDETWQVPYDRSRDTDLGNNLFGENVAVDQDMFLFLS